jgi:hypothetical protein
MLISYAVVVPCTYDIRSALLRIQTDTSQSREFIVRCGCRSPVCESTAAGKEKERQTLSGIVAWVQDLEATVVRQWLSQWLKGAPENKALGPRPSDIPHSREGGLALRRGVRVHG